MPTRQPIEIARLEETRMDRVMRELVDVCDDFAGGVMCYREPASWDNIACNVGLNGPMTEDEAEREADRFIAFYESRGVEPRVELAFYADEQLMLALVRRGLMLREFSNVLAREMDETVQRITPIHATPTDDRGEPLVIEAVRPGDEATIREAAEIANVSFHTDPKPITPGQIESQMKIAAHPRSEVLIARLGGKAVASAGAEHPAHPDDPPVSALFAAAVLEPYRRRGIQQALLIRRMRTAHARGSRIATIHTKPGIATERNCARMGFVLAYAKVVMAKPGPGLVATPEGV